MADAVSNKSDDSKMMLGFIVRRCAAELGHNPTADEFATWANGKNGNQLCLFGKKFPLRSPKSCSASLAEWSP